MSFFQRDQDTICFKERSFKLFGVEIDDRLNFDNQVEILVRIVRQTQADIRGVGQRFPKALGAMLINAMLVSNITNGSILFLNNEKNLKKLRKMLNDSMRFLARKKIAGKVNIKMLSKNWVFQH